MAKFELRIDKLVVDLTEKGCDVSGTAFVYNSAADVTCVLCGTEVPRGTPHACSIQSNPPAPRRRRRVKGK